MHITRTKPGNESDFFYSVVFSSKNNRRMSTGREKIRNVVDIRFLWLSRCVIPLCLLVIYRKVCRSVETRKKKELEANVTNYCSIIEFLFLRYISIYIFFSIWLLMKQKKNTKKSWRMEQRRIIVSTIFYFEVRE